MFLGMGGDGMDVFRDGWGWNGCFWGWVGMEETVRGWAEMEITSAGIGVIFALVFVYTVILLPGSPNISLSAIHS